MSVSKLMLGTVQFGLDYGINNSNGQVQLSEAKAILDLAQENNLDFLDTAEAYGQSHEVLGRAIDTPNSFKIVSKYSSSVSSLPHNFEERINADLLALNTSNLYGYLFHSYKEFKAANKEILEELERLKDLGKIQKLGVSIYTNEELKDLINNEFVEIIQLPFNLLDNSNLRGELLLEAKAKGIEIHTRSVFLQGLFFMHPNEMTGNLIGLKPYLNELIKLAASHNISMNALAIQYAINQSFIDKVLIGVDSREQLGSNLKAANTPVDKSILEKIDDIRVKEVELLNPANWKK